MELTGLSKVAQLSKCLGREAAQSMVDAESINISIREQTSLLYYTQTG